MTELLTIDTTEPTAIRVSSGTILDLLPEDNILLHQPTKEFIFDSSEAKKISNDLIATLKKYKAFGLSANQCGIEYSIFVMGHEDNYITIINPKIIEQSNNIITMQEGCLSYPGLVLGINRPEYVVMKFTNINGEEVLQRFEGLTARIALHEFDHLHGITFNSKAKPLALKNGLKKREKHMKNLARHIVSSQKQLNLKKR